MLQPDAGSLDSSSSGSSSSAVRLAANCVPCVQPAVSTSSSLCLEAIWKWETAVRVLLAWYFHAPRAAARCLDSSSSSSSGSAAQQRVYTCICQFSITHALSARFSFYNSIHIKLLLLPLLLPLQPGVARRSCATSSSAT
jgi:hypothetical protein